MQSTHTKTKLHRWGLNSGPCHCELIATEMTQICMGLTCNPIANVHHHSHTCNITTFVPLTEF
jgi:hypothetical protein